MMNIVSYSKEVIMCDDVAVVECACCGTLSEINPGEWCMLCLEKHYPEQFKDGKIIEVQ
jgi:hypothetical protein